MGASSFSFKQFTVFHDKCAMKVGTDGVLLGAWADVENASTILDIGTGSGLIALMLAQRSLGQITAIDMDKNAIIQAKINVENSPWTERIEIIENDLMHFISSTKMKFDLIVSNPPYFRNSFVTPNNSRTVARHATTNFHNELIISAHTLLQEHGRLCLILPVAEGMECIDFAKQSGLFCSQITTVFPTSNSVAKRLLIEFTLQKQICKQSEIVIEAGERHQYSAAFTALVKEFYLKC